MATPIEIQQQLIESLTKKAGPYQKYGETAQSGAEATEPLRQSLTGSTQITDLIRQIGEQKARLATIPSEVRSEVGTGVFSPTQVSRMVAQEREPNIAQLSMLRGLKESRQGEISDVIDRMRAVKDADIQRVEKKLQGLLQERQFAVKERDYLVDQERYITEQAEGKRRFEEELTLAKGKTGDTEAIIDAFTNQVSNEGLDLVNVPAEYRGQVAVRMAQTTEATEWSKDIVQGLKEGGMTDDAILAAAKEDGVEDEVRTWLETSYQAGGIGGIADTFYSGFKGVKSWLTGK